MSLRFRRDLALEVAREAERAFPEECCGFLIGVPPEDFNRVGRTVTVSEVSVLPNGWEGSDRGRRYSIDPLDFERTERRLLGTGLCIVGFYHSHPDAPAWPSPFDLERAWPCYSYWIVSVRSGKAAESRSWMRDEDGRNFMEEEIVQEE